MAHKTSKPKPRRASLRKRAANVLYTPRRRATKLRPIPWPTTARCSPKVPARHSTLHNRVTITTRRNRAIGPLRPFRRASPYGGPEPMVVQSSLQKRLGGREPVSSKETPAKPPLGPVQRPPVWTPLTDPKRCQTAPPWCPVRRTTLPTPSQDTVAPTSLITVKPLRLMDPAMLSWSASCAPPGSAELGTARRLAKPAGRPFLDWPHR